MKTPTLAQRTLKRSFSRTKGPSAASDGCEIIQVEMQEDERGESISEMAFAALAFLRRLLAL